MRRVPFLLRGLILFSLMCTAGTGLHAQEYPLTISPRFPGTSKSTKEIAIQRQLQYSIPLSLSAREIDKIRQERPQTIRLSFPSSLPLPSTVELSSFDVFTRDAKTFEVGASGDQETSFRNEWLSFRADIPGDNRSIIVLNISPLGVDAMIRQKGETYFLRSAGDGSGGEAAPYLFYAAAAVRNQAPFHCGVADAGDPAQVSAIIHQLDSQRNNTPGNSATPGAAPALQSAQPHVPNPFGPAISSDTIEVRVALEGDYELFLAMGSEQAAMNVMMSTASYASAVYLNEVAVKLTVPFARVWTTESSPYHHTDLFTSLDDFVRYWSQSMNSVDRSITHLFTNSARWTSVSGFAGIAKLNSLCSNLTGYGVTDVRDPLGDGQLMTFTHEVGHNFGAHHTHSCFWPGGPLDYCAPIEDGNCYSGPIVQSDGTIMSYCATRRFEFGSVVASLIRRNAEFAACAPSLHPLPVALADSTTLHNLYTSTGGSGWTSSSNWQSGAIPDRYGITVRGGRVISINLPANNLSGTLPENLSALTALRVLNLSGRSKYHVEAIAPPDPATDRIHQSNLTGQIPAAIGQLTSLEELDLSDNKLTGAFPDGVLNLSQLHVLNLSENAITGSIPSTIGNLTNLETLDLWRTSMTGQIPASIGNLHILRVLVLSETYGSAENQYTRLNGPIPAEIGTATRLAVLNLSGNSLSGTLPAQLGNLRSLIELNLGNNKFTGAIPAELTNLGGLQTLALNDNNLSGPVPSYLGTFTNLSSVTVANNKLSGPIPAELGKLTQLYGFHLENNQLTGPIPPSLGGLRSALDFDVHGNALTGPIPDSLRNLGLDAPGDFGGLVLFRIGDNRLTGKIPDWLANRPTISELDLGGNQFDDPNGPIPDWVFQRTSLSLLHLHGMGYTGTFPTQVFKFASMSSLKLSGNKLTGSIPTQIGTLSSLNTLWLSDNALSGALPSELGNAHSLMDLRLANNQFEGPIPSSISDLGGVVQHLDLSGNRLSGSVPASFETLGSVVVLDLSNNELTSIPALFRLYHVLHDSAGYLAVQNNRLTFGSIAPMMFANAQIPFLNFSYIPQKPFGSAIIVKVIPGTDTTLAVVSDDPRNTFQWTREGQPLAGATSPTYRIGGATEADTGQYRVTVKNGGVPLLTLESESFTIRLSYTSRPEPVTLADPANGAGNIPTNITLVWKIPARVEFYRFQLARDSSFTTIVLDTATNTIDRYQRSLLPNTRYFWRVRAENSAGTGDYSPVWSFTTSTTISDVAVTGLEVPQKFFLEQNYPNPFNPSTVIRFALPAASHARLTIYSVLGQLIGTLVDEELQAGTYAVPWNAARLPSGMYVYTLQAGSYHAARKLFLLK